MAWPPVRKTLFGGEEPLVHDSFKEGIETFNALDLYKSQGAL